jgi:hypothetical protein
MQLQLYGSGANEALTFVTSCSTFIHAAGANRGLGYELCRILVQNKHPVIVACRTQEKGMRFFVRKPLAVTISQG